MNTSSPLIAELKDKEYRDGYVAAQISLGLPNQIRALRVERKWTQSDLARLARMAQPRICEIEKPGERKLNLDTLQRIASAFDVGLEVNFVPFSELIDRSERFNPDAFSVKSFDEEIAETEQAEKARSQPSPVKTNPISSFDSVQFGCVLAGVQTGGLLQQAISTRKIWERIMSMMATGSTMSAIEIPDYAKIHSSHAASPTFSLRDSTKTISSALGSETVDTTPKSKPFLVPRNSTGGKPEDVQEDAIRYSIQSAGDTSTPLRRKYA